MKQKKVEADFSHFNEAMQPLFSPSLTASEFEKIFYLHLQRLRHIRQVRAEVLAVASRVAPANAVSGVFFIPFSANTSDSAAIPAQAFPTAYLASSVSILSAWKAILLVFGQNLSEGVSASFQPHF